MIEARIFNKENVLSLNVCEVVEWLGLNDARAETSLSNANFVRVSERIIFCSAEA